MLMLKATTEAEQANCYDGQNMAGQIDKVFVEAIFLLKKSKHIEKYLTFETYYIILNIRHYMAKILNSLSKRNNILLFSNIFCWWCFVHRVYFIISSCCCLIEVVRRCVPEVILSLF